MAKHKTVKHLPPPTPPRLAAQLFVALGELVVAGIWPEAEASGRARCFRSLGLTGRALRGLRSSKMTLS
jgi:hypothetical protein